MPTSFRMLLLAGTALVASSAACAEPASLEDRIAALEAMVAGLKNELVAERADTDREVVRLETIASAAAANKPVASPSGFTVGETTFRISGIVDLDAHFTTLSDGAIDGASIARDFYIPGATPVGGDETQFTDFTAEASRFAFTAERPFGDDKVTGYLELDFLGSAQGNELVTNSYSPRLRRAYVTYGNWLAGQEWTTFQNTSAIPESVSFLILSDGMVFVRQPQIRYTHGNWQFALENPNTDTVNAGARDETLVPDVIGRYNWKGDFGNVSLSGVARQLRADFGPSEDEAWGYGLSLSGQVKLGKRDDIRFNLVGGEGLGRYVGLAAIRSAAVDASGRVEAIPGYGGLIAWRHPFGETARFNLGYSAQWADNPDFVAGTATKSVQSAYGALLWDVAPKVTLGTELMYGIRETESGLDGTLTRMTFSTKYAF